MAEVDPGPRRLIYLFGGPAVGKSTLTRRVFTGWESTSFRAGGVPLVEHRSGARHIDEIGVVRDEFPGTDGLSMSILPKAIQLLTDRPAHYYAEGDRLANARFFTAASVAGYDLRLFWLCPPDDVVAGRRKNRVQKLAWVQGRDTKASRLAVAWGAKWLAGGDDDVNVVAAALPP